MCSFLNPNDSLMSCHCWVIFQTHSFPSLSFIRSLSLSPSFLHSFSLEISLSRNFSLSSCLPILSHFLSKLTVSVSRFLFQWSLLHKPVNLSTVYCLCHVRSNDVTWLVVPVSAISPLVQFSNIHSLLMWTFTWILNQEFCPFERENSTFKAGNPEFLHWLKIHEAGIWKNTMNGHVEQKKNQRKKDYFLATILYSQSYEQLAFKFWWLNFRFNEYFSSSSFIHFVLLSSSYYSENVLAFSFCKQPKEMHWILMDILDLNLSL